MSSASPDFILVSEVDDARIARPIFRRKLGGDPPEVPHHVVSFYRAPDGALWPASYVHFRPFGDIYLVGGASTDGEVMRRMRDEEREAVKAAGGLYLQALRWAFAHYADRCDAYFGYCGDARASSHCCSTRKSLPESATSTPMRRSGTPSCIRCAPATA